METIQTNPPPNKTKTKKDPTHSGKKKEKQLYITMLQSTKSQAPENWSNIVIKILIFCNLQVEWSSSWMEKD